MEHTTLPVWFEQVSAQQYQKLEGKRTADVVVIGAGITGLTIAYLLAKAGRSVIVLEALTVGKGTTGFSTGNLYCTIDSRIYKFVDRYDLEKAKKVLNSRTEAINLIERICEEEYLDASFRRVPWTLVAEEDDEMKTIEKEYKALNDAGINAHIIEDVPLMIPVKNAVTIDGQAQVNPYAYVSGLAEAAIRHKAQVYEHSAAVSWEEKEGHVSVQTVAGEVEAHALVMATHIPKGIAMVQTLLGPYREYGVAAVTNGAVIPDGIFWVAGKKHHHSMRNYKAGGKDYLVVISEHFKTGQEEDTRESLGTAIDFLRKCGFNTISHSWGAQHYRPADGLPYIGRGDKNSRIYHATGFSTDGLTYGTLAAMIISDEINSNENQWAETYAYSRHNPGKAAKAFIKENLNVAGQYLKDIPFKGGELDEIKPGEGKVVKYDKEKVAAYRTPQGELKCVSAVCTHMECIVNFNHAERSWDCPCHGSRFTVDGEVIEGPAVANLEKINLKVT